MNTVQDRRRRRNLRHLRIRKRIRGTGARPRLAVYRSLKHIYAQIVNDEGGTGSVTLVAASTRDKALRERLKAGGNVTAAKAVGEEIAARALAKGIKEVSFDRGGCRYHGRIKALADSAREKGLVF